MLKFGIFMMVTTKRVVKSPRQIEIYLLVEEHCASIYRVEGKRSVNFYWPIRHYIPEGRILHTAFYS
jgi:hypothetical protein